MVYKCFNIYLLWYRVYLECLQVQRLFGGKWWFWCLLEPFECRAAQTRQMFSYGWRPSHHYIEPILWNKIDLRVIFPMPPVWGQSAFYNRSYARFTEEWSVCLARVSCRGDCRSTVHPWCHKALPYKICSELSFYTNQSRYPEIWLKLTWSSWFQSLIYSFIVVKHTNWHRFPLVSSYYSNLIIHGNLTAVQLYRLRG